MNCPRIGIKHNDAPVAVSVGNEELVRLCIHEGVGGLIQVLRIGVAFALSGLADLHHELSVLCELQDLMILGSVAANPDELFVIDVNAMLRSGPVEARSGASPRAKEISGSVELENRRRCLALFVRLERRGTLQDPDVIGGINRNTRDLAELPLVGIFGHEGSTTNSGAHQVDSSIGEDVCAAGVRSEGFLKRRARRRRRGRGSASWIYGRCEMLLDHGDSTGRHLAVLLAGPTGYAYSAHEFSVHHDGNSPLDRHRAIQREHA